MALPTMTKQWTVDVTKRIDATDSAALQRFLLEMVASLQAQGFAVERDGDHITIGPRRQPSFPKLVDVVAAIDGHVGVQSVREMLQATVQRCAQAEELLRRIANSRLAFSLDTGGPASPAEGMKVIEEWVHSHFKGDFYGDIKVTISDALK